MKPDETIIWVGMSSEDYMRGIETGWCKHSAGGYVFWRQSYKDGSCVEFGVN